MSEACRLRRDERYGVCTDDVTICVKKALRCNRFLAYILEGGVCISKTQNNANVRYREHYLRRITRGYGRKPLGTKGALLYMVCRHVVRSVRLQAQTSEYLGFFASLAFRTRVPLAPLCGYPNNNYEKEK